MTLKNATLALELTLKEIIEARKARPPSDDNTKLTFIDPRDWQDKPIPTRDESMMERAVLLRHSGDGRRL